MVRGDRDKIVYMHSIYGLWNVCVCVVCDLNGFSTG